MGETRVFAGLFLQGNLFATGIHESMHDAMEAPERNTILWTHDDLTGERILLAHHTVTNGTVDWEFQHA